MVNTKHIRIGILVPSSNTALEPLTTQIISNIPNVSVHFSRFGVTKIDLSDDAIAQFEVSRVLDAAQLLADAHVDVIGWSGTSAGWLGFEVDEKLCTAIQDITGIKATTSTLALNKALKLLEVRKLGLVTPYTGDVQEVIIKNYAANGVDICVEQHLSRTDNVNFAALRRDTFDPMIEDVFRQDRNVDAVTTFCTNLSTAALVAEWEERFKAPVLDSVTAVVWDCLKMCDIDTALVQGWGMLMQL